MNTRRAARARPRPPPASNGMNRASAPAHSAPSSATMSPCVWCSGSTCSSRSSRRQRHASSSDVHRRGQRRVGEAHALGAPGRARRVEHQRVAVASGGAADARAVAGDGASVFGAQTSAARPPARPPASAGRERARSPPAPRGAASSTTCASSGAACSGDSGTASPPARQIADQRFDVARARLDQERHRPARPARPRAAQRRGAPRIARASAP